MDARVQPHHPQHLGIPQLHPRIFEIGPCFRTDDPDLGPFFDGEFIRLSIAECLRDTFGVDLTHARVGALSGKMAKAVGLSKAALLPEVSEQVHRIGVGTAQRRQGRVPVSRVRRRVEAAGSSRGC
jgi:hypothetical protein